MLNKIKALKSSLRRSEQKVADAVLAQPDVFVKSSIVALARAADVSEPTVMRFCQALGCAGFQAFKLELARDLAYRVRYARRNVMSDDSGDELAAKVIDGAIASLVQVRSQLNRMALERAIALLAGAARIEFYGLGGAGIVAADAQLKFCRLGVPAVAYADAHIHNVAASLLSPDSAVVAISNSGRSLDLLRSVDFALATGAAVIGITASGSPLAERCMVSLTVDGFIDDDYALIRTRIAHMVVIDTLAIGVALKRSPAVLDRLRNVQHVLEDKFLSA